MTISDAIDPYRIAINENLLDDLHERLRRSRFPEPLPADDWNTGVPSTYLRQLVDYWLNEFDWREAEAELNDIPQYRTLIDGTPIHFLHVRSPETGRVAACPHPWMARIVRRIRRSSWAVERSTTVRGRSGRRLSRCRADASRFRLLHPTW